MVEARNVERADVYRGAVRVGALHRTGHGSVFTYDDLFYEEHRKRAGGIAVHLPYAKQRHEHRGDNLSPYFAGLLPEGFRLKHLIQQTKTSESDLFSLLLAAGADTVGDISAVASGEPFFTHSPKVHLRTVSEIRFSELWKQSLNAPNGTEPVVPGVQDKLSPSMISFPLVATSRRKAYILKLNPPDRPRLIENEAFFMNCARDCGLEVAAHSLVHDSEEAAGLLVERFDRVWNQQSKTLERLHQEDACQFLNRYPQDKYRLSCAEIAEGLSVCGAALPARGKFLERVAFSYVICNGDLHAKNISILETPIGLACSPAYDLLSTLPYGDRKMALKMEGRDDNLKRRDFVNFGQRIGLSHSFVEGMLERLTTQVSPWIDRLSEIGLSEKRRADLEVTMRKRVQELQEKPGKKSS